MESWRQIPLDKEWCEKLDISKITVQKAKQELLAEGVLEILPGRRGTFVSHQTRHISSSDFIGVAIDDVKTIPFDAMLHGIEDKLWEYRLHPIPCNVHSNYEKVEDYFHSLLKGAVAGVIFAPVRGSKYLDSEHIVNLLAERHIPCVLIDRYIPGLLINSVHSNNLQASKELTKKLIAKGHTRILVVVGTECTTIQNRLQGYLDALEEAGLAHDPNLIIRINDIAFETEHLPQEIERIRAHLGQAGDFTACYTLNSPAFQAVVTAIFENKNPQQQWKRLEFATYDYIPQEVTKFVNHTLVVKQPAYQMGWEAARLLMDVINTPNAPIIQMTLKSELVEEVIV